jgi:AbrB family looped-hinge helix DNA binding protein
METTHLSSKGQVVIPQFIREAHHWQPGFEFFITETKKGILLTPVKPFKKFSIEQIIGCVGYKGAKKSLKAMEKGIAKGAKKQK